MLDKIISSWVRERLNSVSISTDIVRRGRKWSLIVTSDDEDHSYSNRWTDAINWTIEQLEGWPDCDRMAYDTWYFKKKRDAEKFSTLFTLKWAK